MTPLLPPRCRSPHHFSVKFLKKLSSPKQNWKRDPLRKIQKISLLDRQRASKVALETSRHLGSSTTENWVSFDFNVVYSSRWGYSLINTLKLKKTRNFVPRDVFQCPWWAPSRCSQSCRAVLRSHCCPDSWEACAAQTVLCSSETTCIAEVGPAPTQAAPLWRCRSNVGTNPSLKRLGTRAHCETP